MNNWFFTADEHYGHSRIIDYCDRPFQTATEMDRTLIHNFNGRVGNNDITVHIGDFTLQNRKEAEEYIKQLNGQHVFIKGSHDYWLKQRPLSHEIWSRRFNEQLIVCCHYAMRVWPASHYGSIQLYGHSHGKLEPRGKQQDVGVDVWNYFPVALEELLELPHLTGG